MEGRSQLKKRTCRVNELQTILSAGQKCLFVGLVELETRSEQSQEECLRDVTTEAGDLTGGTHLNTKMRIGTSETRETEHGCLASHKVQLVLVDRMTFHWNTKHDLRGSTNKVEIKGLGNEREGSGTSKIALDNLELVVLCHELNVERTADVKSGHDFVGNTNRLTFRLCVPVFEREARV